jgi:UDP-N-acetylglucosamine 3-dehydrogenase
MRNLKAGLIGLGMMGRNHARVLSKLEGVDLVAIADPLGDVSRVLPRHIVLKSIDEVLARGVDYCVVAAPTAFHEEICLKIIDCGVHVLIEKPIAHNLLSAQQIVKAAEKKGVIAAVGHIERYNSALRQARGRVQNNELGEIFQVSTRRTGPFPARIADVGVIMDLATHDFDLTRWITSSDYQSLHAEATSRSGRDFEDLVVIAAKMNDGTVVNHVVNWLSPIKERKTIITGEKGTFLVDTLTSDVTFYANGTVDVLQDTLAHFRGVTQGDIRVFAFQKPEPLQIEHENFRDKIRGKDAEIVSLEDALKAVEIAESAIKSYKIKRSVEI